MSLRQPYRGGTCPHGIYLDTRCFTCQPGLCMIRSTHVHEFHGIHADVSHLQGRPPTPAELDREVPEPSR